MRDDPMKPGSRARVKFAVEGGVRAMERSPVVAGPALTSRGGEWYRNQTPSSEPLTRDLGGPHEPTAEQRPRRRRRRRHPRAQHGLAPGLELARRRRGTGRDVLVLDKTGVGAGASGIACGCVRNLYMTEPLHAILRHSVDVWMYDPVAFGFQQVGYVGVDEEQNLPAYERVWKSQNAAGYPVRPLRRRGRPPVRAGPLARLQHHARRPRPPREGERLRRHAPGGRRPRRQVRRAGGAGPARGRGDRLRRRGRAGARGPHRPGADRAATSWSGASAPGRRSTGRCSGSPRRSTAAIRTAASRRRTCGRTGGSWRARSTTTSRT